MILDVAICPVLVLRHANLLLPILAGPWSLHPASDSVDAQKADDHLVTRVMPSWRWVTLSIIMLPQQIVRNQIQ